MNANLLLENAVHKLYGGIIACDTKAQAAACDSLRSIPCITIGMITERRDIAQRRYDNAIAREASIKLILTPFYWEKRLADQLPAIHSEMALFVVAVRLFNDVLKARRIAPPVAQRLVMKVDPPKQTPTPIPESLRSFGARKNVKRIAVKATELHWQRPRPSLGTGIHPCYFDFAVEPSVPMQRASSRSTRRFQRLHCAPLVRRSRRRSR
jgi:hypothetical protein